MKLFIELPEMLFKVSESSMRGLVYLVKTIWVGQCVEFVRHDLIKSPKNLPKCRRKEESGGSDFIYEEKYNLHPMHPLCTWVLVLCASI